MSEIIAEQGGYRVIQHGPLQHQTTIVSFQARNGVIRHPTEHRDYGVPFVPERITSSDIPANFISVITNRNGWYIDDDAVALAQGIRTTVGTGRIVTYGSSMGGFAAINLSGVLDAAYILALSPLSTLFPPFTEVLHDRRYAEDAALLPNINDFIGNGSLVSRRGALFFDPWQPQDAGHAARIASLTRMELAGVPYSGHPCGAQLNQLYPLRSLLMDVAVNEPDMAAIKSLLAVPVKGLSPVLGDDPLQLPSFILRCWADMPAAQSVSMSNAAFLVSIARSAGVSRPDLIAQLKDLVNIALHPDFNWGKERNMRAVCLRKFAAELHKNGERELAVDIVKRHLPKALADKLMEGPMGRPLKG